MKDQAEKLRARLKSLGAGDVQEAPRATKIITVCSGKGGVGKSNFSLNFALSLIDQQKKVMIFDVDIGLANIDVLMGLPPKRTISDMIEQDLSIEEIIEEGPRGIQFVAGGSGFQHLFHTDEKKLTKLFNELHTLQGEVDYIILDTGAGLSKESLRFILAADDVMIVTTPEPTSITDAYAVLKMVYLKEQETNIQIVVNRCSTITEGKNTGQKLQLVAKQFLGKQIDILGYIADDANVMKAVKKQTPFVIQYPKSHAAQSLKDMSLKYLNRSPTEKKGFSRFLKKLFQA